MVVARLNNMTVAALSSRWLRRRTRRRIGCYYCALKLRTTFLRGNPKVAFFVPFLRIRTRPTPEMRLKWKAQQTVEGRTGGPRRGCFWIWILLNGMKSRGVGIQQVIYFKRLRFYYLPKCIFVIWTQSGPVLTIPFRNGFTRIRERRCAYLLYPVSVVKI